MKNKKPGELQTKLLILLDEFENYQNKFYEKVKQEKFDKNVAEKWWKIISGQASYSFAKSHSYPYSKLTYLTMYLKANYPKEFMLSLLNNTARAKEDKEGTNEISKIIFSAQRDYGVEVLPPDINKSSICFTLEDNKIRFGLSAIKDVGKAADEIINKQPYKNFYDFIRKTDKVREINKRVILALIFSGCFNKLNPDKNEILETYLNNKTMNMKPEQNTFINFNKYRKEEDRTEKYNNLKLIQKEIEYINLSFEKIYDSEEFPILSSIKLPDDKIKFVAYVESKKDKVSKNNRRYIVLRLTDFKSHLNILCFGNTRDILASSAYKKGSLVKIEAVRAGKDSNAYFCEDVNIVKN